ncbi:L,D-transpeptidase [Paracoccus sp. (in: a-proteobacteria)]|uniref:L,D-transpeptidase n=1 Tax=Paracoccus sp. TaxID=267 RepID=UPI0026DF6C08|nr:L,D-transpeptidase [Paracoccus sp. (in: a-proteobacteria)]MDO5647064.1 L,D-transpeptidase [Paracoccus sp. (in: a-proteobacteria)]
MNRPAAALSATFILTACAPGFDPLGPFMSRDPGAVSAPPPVAVPVAEARPPAAPERPAVSAATRAMYAAVNDGGHAIPAIPDNLLTPNRVRSEVDYWSSEPVGTIIVDPHARYLYQIRPNNRAMRYAVGVGAAGFGFTGAAHIPYQREWPRWQPTDGMLERQPEHYGPMRDGLPGGLRNPLGARALYIHNSGGDTYYRIHGTNDPASIGTASSSGCIRMFNQDAIHLAANTPSMTNIIVLTREQSGQGTRRP